MRQLMIVMPLPSDIMFSGCLFVH